MLFETHHIKLIVDGEKTATRRRWDSSQVIEGNSYRACESLFTPREESPAYIVVNDVYQEQLGEMTEQDAQKEGRYSLDEFRTLWKEMHGEWNPQETVWVVEFDGHQTDPRNT
jgi:hypothetical protein